MDEEAQADHLSILPNDPDLRQWMAGFDGGQWEYENAADWFCQETTHYGDSRIGVGETEDEAIESLCKLYRVPLWNEVID
jgi:hypothetical protein